MLKHYFKKLLNTLLFLIACYTYIAAAEYAWYYIGTLLQELLSITFPRAVNLAMGILLAGSLTVVMVYFMRHESVAYKSKYKKAHAEGPVSFQKDFVSTFISADNVLHTAAFLTLLLPILILIGTSANTPILLRIVGILLLLAVGGALFAAVNTLMWCLVHKKWLEK